MLKNLYKRILFVIMVNERITLKQEATGQKLPRQRQNTPAIYAMREVKP